MEGSQQQPPTEQPREPTSAEAMQIAQQAMQAATEAKNAVEARPAAQAAVEEEAEAKGLEITEEQAELIANVTIQQLEARGAFGEPQGEPAQTPEQAIAAAAQGQTPPAPPESSQQPPAPTETAQQQPPAPAPPAAEEVPRRKSLAERFQGK